MLGGSISNEEDPTIINQGDDSDDDYALGTLEKSHDKQRKKHNKNNNNNDDDDDDDGGYDNIEGEALLRAIEENPSLVVQHPELADTINKSKAAELKEQGNRAFIAKDYQYASDIFTQCIALDPGNEVYYSNRAAALMKLTGRLNEALKDAQQAVTLATGWAKAWVRCGECHFLLRNYVEAEETYRRAMKLEPDNNSIQEGLMRVVKAAKEEEELGKHVFKMKKRGGGGGGDGGEGGKVKNGDQGGGGSKGIHKKALLSFGDDEDEEGVM
jgi:tetratricopeptide (TPR) repeat protein